MRELLGGIEVPKYGTAEKLHDAGSLDLRGRGRSGYRRWTGRPRFTTLVDIVYDNTPQIQYPQFSQIANPIPALSVQGYPRPLSYTA